MLLGCGCLLAMAAAFAPRVVLIIMWIVGDRINAAFNNALIPILGIAVVLPISLNGLGVRELVATQLMPQVGIAAPTAFTMQIVTYLVQVAVSVVGGLVLVWMMMTGRLTLRRPKQTNSAA